MIVFFLARVGHRVAFIKVGMLPNACRVEGKIKLIGVDAMCTWILFEERLGCHVGFRSCYGAKLPVMS